MECAELEKLREQVRDIRKEMSTRQEQARARAAKDPRSDRKDGYKELLERKLGRAITQIEQHVTRHQCQE